MGMKRTALFGAHQKLGGKLVEFGGWEMPVQYTSITDEHLAVRQAAGIFDISHMGEILVAGSRAVEFLNRVLTNDVRKLEVGLGQYTLLCHENGGVIDDLYLYCLNAERYLLIVNASRIEADFAWIEKQAAGAAERSGLEIQNASETFGAVAVQGPRVREFIDECVPGASVGGKAVDRASDLKKNQIARFEFRGDGAWASRTGYTGEDGFEIVAPVERIVEVWDECLKAGAPHGIKPAGLGARDTLRTEVCYPLYGHELDENTTPIEAGLGFFVALDKGDFAGRAALLEQKTSGVKRKLAAFRMAGKSAPPRPQYPIWEAAPGGRQLGAVASGTQSPSLGVGIGLGYVPPEYTRPGTAIEIEIRGRRAEAEVVSKPIFRKS
jgi:aminomethyltransferase